MKKIYMVSIAAATMMFAGNASAVDSTGCGLGSMAWRGHEGTIPQVAAVTTNNVSFSSQTFGITSGTSGCDPQGRINGGTGRMVFNFLQNNMEQYALDAAKGSGETLATLAGILNVDEAVLASKSKENFAVLFPTQDADAVYVTVQLLEIMKA
ncbi:MAG: DUF3015 domain-containing protein [Lactobacillaceae bacterium]|jgi:hypothetical protein|nr:DUF3015 domain-containing protein [Lactobacillaceae bacterium]